MEKPAVDPGPPFTGKASEEVKTHRLRLVACEVGHLEAILDDERGRLGEMLGVSVPEDAFGFPGTAGVKILRRFHERLKADPGLLGWWMYLFVHAEDRVVVGQGGYKGRPDAAGTVEIGYAISPTYRRQGLATEAAQGLVDHAFAHDRVSRVDAHTLAEPNASTKVLRKAGMEFVETVEDPRIGEAWRWSLSRSKHGRV